MLTLIKNPDIVVAHPEVNSCSCSSIYSASIDYYSFAGVTGSGHSVSAYYVCYTGYNPLSSYTTATRKGF